MINRLILLLLTLLFVSQLYGRDTESAPSPIVFIYDASGSMWGDLQGKTKMQIAAKVMSKTVNALPENQRVGFVAYGHRQKGDCEDVEFMIDINNAAKENVTTAVAGIKPLGKTPLAYSAIQVINKLRETKQKATIILMTDGIESCGGNICEVIRAAKAEGIDFKLHIIGFGLKDGETDQLECAAKEGDGNYYDADDTAGLSGALEEATASTVDDPDGNFSVYTVKNGQPVDAFVRAFTAGTDDMVDTRRTYGDSAWLYLPAGKYDLVVRALENSDVAGIKISGVESYADKKGHQTVSFDAGKIKIMASNNDEAWDAVINVFSSADGKRVAGGRTYSKAVEIELNPGSYEVELKPLKVEGLNVNRRFKDIEVSAGQIAEVTHNFKSGIAMIGANSSDGLVDATVRIIDTSAGKAVANGRTYTSESNNPRKFILQPGTYEVRLKALGAHKGKTATLTMEVKAGEQNTQITTF